MKLLSLVDNVILSIEESTSAHKENVPVELVKALETFDTESISEFLQDLRREGLSFSIPEQEVKLSAEAFVAVQKAESREFKIFYALLFVSFMFGVTQNTVNHLLFERLTK